MRHLGIDYGRKRVGLALSDETGQMAFPHAVVKNDTSLLTELEAVIAEHNVEVIVIGHSKDKAGEDNPIHEAATELMSDLTLKTGLPVHLEPEQYSTQEALRFQGRTEHTDAAAAAIILNSYLTRADA
ncbi:Holliday junction resolvase RuvX [bacterium]|nr:Holliday junction resolvase RuvX [bacterium]|tara:strand:- start:979 stop:1362 length:384 start_codon:yes stop_codon:yes gene_type:complete